MKPNVNEEIYDAVLTVHPRRRNGTRTLSLVFTPDYEERVKLSGMSFLESLNVVEGAMCKSLDVQQNRHGRFIICVADDPALAEDEAIDMKELLRAHIKLNVLIHVSEKQPRLVAEDIG